MMKITGKVTSTTEKEVKKFLNGLRNYDDIIDFYMNCDSTCIYKQRDTLVIFMMDRVKYGKRAMEVGVTKSDLRTDDIYLSNKSKRCASKKFMVGKEDVIKDIMEFIKREAKTLAL